MPSSHNARIVKASDARDMANVVDFNFEDIRSKCDAYIESTKQKATQMLAAAKSECDSIREEARNAGRQHAREEAFRDADAEIARKAEEKAQQLAAERLKSALPAVQAAASAFVHELDLTIEHWEQTVVGLAVGIAEKLIHREIAADRQPVLANVQHALTVAAGQSGIRLHLNKTDAETLSGPLRAVLKRSNAVGAEVVPDESLAPGDCVVRTHEGIVDGRTSTRLARVLEELGIDTEVPSQSVEREVEVPDEPRDMPPADAKQDVAESSAVVAAEQEERNEVGSQQSDENSSKDVAADDSDELSPDEIAALFGQVQPEQPQTTPNIEAETKPPQQDASAGENLNQAMSQDDIEALLNGESS